MMKAALRAPLALSIAIVLSAVMSAKGDTTKITITGDALAKPVDITDGNLVRDFQVWTGPGTNVCLGGRSNCSEGTEGFIVDWASGPVAEPPTGLQRYEISFYVTDTRVPGKPEPERLAYVVS
jgi:hypothetical protein